MNINGRLLVSPVKDRIKHPRARRLGHVKRGHLEVVEKAIWITKLQEEEEGRPKKNSNKAMRHNPT